jgi:hypothetical protein
VFESAGCLKALTPPPLSALHVVLSAVCRECGKVLEWEAQVSYQQARLDKAAAKLAEAHADNIDGYIKHRTKYCQVWHWHTGRGGG